MTRRVLQASAILLGLVLAFQVGRLSATPRSAAPVIPAPSMLGAGEPDPGQRTEAPRAGVGSDVDRGPASEEPARSASPSPTARRTPKPVAPARGVFVSGIATWFCLPGRSACTVGIDPSCLCAAAGPALRAAIGPGWRGKIVETCLSNRPMACVRVRLTDWCLCGHGRVIDLYSAAFSRLAPLSRGVLAVTVEHG